MKTLAKKFTKVFLERLSPEARAALFLYLAKTLGVRAFSIDGDNGLITGAAGDRVIFHNYLLRRTWSPEILSFLKSQMLKSGGGFLDIGANIGLFTVPMARLPNVKVIAFEPDPSNFQHLTTNIQVNNVRDNVITHNVALLDRKADVPFELSKDNFGDHRIHANGNFARATNSYGEGGRQTITVAADRLDSLVSAAKLQGPLVIKMDVQGAEPAVLAGGASIFAVADALVVEFWPYGIRRLGGDPKSFLADITTSFPFMASVAEDEPIAARKFRPTAVVVSELGGLALASDTSHVDLVLVKKIPT